MKKWIMAVVLLVAVVGGGFSYLWWGPPKLRLVARGGIAAAFTHDLHEFVLQHEGRLPTDWKEFEEWETEQDGETRWPAEASAKRFEILSPPDHALGHCPRFVRVTDPDLMWMEERINAWVNGARAQLGMTDGVANKASEDIGAGAPNPQR